MTVDIDMVKHRVQEHFEEVEQKLNKSPSDPAGSISIDDQIEAIQGNIQMLKNSGMVKGEWVDGDMQHEVVVLEAAIYTLRQISKRS